jgi:ABC-2 type transport system permease protein
MSRNIIQVFLYELQRNLRRKGFLLATFGLPILLFLLSTGANLFQARNENVGGLPINLPAFDYEGIDNVGFVDLSGEFAAVPEKLQANFTRYETEDAARAALNAKEIDIFYVIQPDYLETGQIVQHLPRFSINLLEDAPDLCAQC